MAGRRRTCEIVNLIDFEKDRQRNVVANQLKVGVIEQMDDVRFLACKKIIEADYVVTAFDQSLAKMRTEKSGSPGHKNPFNRRHVACSPRTRYPNGKEERNRYKPGEFFAPP
jgi:hypothetical protein